MLLRDVRPGIIFKLCNILDLQDDWKKLAGELGYSMTDIQTFQNVGYRRLGSGGPTECLIFDWFTQMPTVEQLHGALYRLKLFHACNVLQEVINPNPGYKNLQMPPQEVSQSQAPYPGPAQHQGQSPQGYPYYMRQMSQGPHYSQGYVSQGPHGQMYQGQMYYSNNEHMGPISLPQAPMDQAQQGIPLPTPPPAYHTVAPFPSQKILSPDVNLNTGKSDKSLDRIKVKSLAPLVPCTEPSNLKDGTDPGDRRTQSGVLLDVIRFPWGDIRDGTDDFNPRNIIGNGGYGKVYHANLRKTNCAVKVLKRFDRPDEKQETIESNLMELSALFKYRHQNIIGLIGYSVYCPNTCIVYEFMANGSLEDRLQCKNGTPPLSWETRHRVAMGAARGLQYLHTAQTKALIHGDVKSANILLDQNMEAKLSDFGHARQVKAAGSKVNTTMKELKASPIFGTLAYLPIHFFDCSELSISTDTFGYGVVLFEVCTGQKAKDSKREKEEDHYLRDYVRNVYSCPAGLDALLELCDPLAGSWPDEIYKKMMQLGIQCTEQRKKLQPQMTKVLTTLEHLEGESQLVRLSQSMPANEESRSVNSSSMTGVHHFEFESSPSTSGKLLQLPCLQPPSSVGSSKSFGTLDSYPDGTSSELKPAGDPEFLAFNPDKLTPSELLRESQLGQQRIEQGMHSLRVDGLVSPSLREGGSLKSMSVPYAMQLVYDSGGKIPVVGCSKNGTAADSIDAPHHQQHHHEHHPLPNDLSQVSSDQSLESAKPSPAVDSCMGASRYAKFDMTSLLGSDHLAHVRLIQKKKFPFEMNIDSESDLFPEEYVDASTAGDIAPVMAVTRTGTEGVDQPLATDPVSKPSQYYPLRQQNHNLARVANSERPASALCVGSELAEVAYLAAAAHQRGQSLKQTSMSRSSEFAYKVPSFEAPISAPVEDSDFSEMSSGNRGGNDLYPQVPKPVNISNVLAEDNQLNQEPASEDDSRLKFSQQLRERHRKLKEPQEW